MAPALAPSTPCFRESFFSSGDLELSENQSQSALDSHAFQEEHAPLHISRKETQDVVRLRLVVLLVLVSTAIGVACTTYWYLTRAERLAFEAQFASDSTKLLQAMGSSLDKTLGLFDSLAVTLVSSAQAANETWPFVTLPNFAMRLSKVLPLSDAFTILVLPLVTEQQRFAWETIYTPTHNDWVNESIHVQETWNGYFGPTIESWTPNPHLHNDLGPLESSNTSRVHFPQWQNFPVIPVSQFPYNYDWLSVSAPEALMSCYTKHRTIVSEPYMIPRDDDVRAQEETLEWAKWHADFLPDDEEPIEPVSDVFYPIIDELSRVQVAGADDSDHHVVGVIAASFYWRQLFRNVLPTGSNGTLLVVENTCTDAFSYQIDGPLVRYMGVGDHHDTKYNHLMTSSPLLQLGTFAVRNSTYSGARLEEFCSLRLTLYPSNDMRAKHTTHHPILFTVCAMLIVAFTSLVFLLYDRMVERRQERVLQTAVQSTAIVSSLFPAAVRTRLFSPEPIPETARGRIQTFLDDDVYTNRRARDVSNEVVTNSPPIAELYPDTTVFFADIAGFTAWSSQRQPTEVFHLLETIYGAFDAIAKRRRVFKVETIGDCYVAVVGLPTPRTHHAAVMAKFAAECRHVMAEVTLSLERTLGPGTADLALRIGLNSGPTTAGVLRGDKARFQLFGDTVNTAARMESTGERNKIQVSQKTADLIRLAGRGYWLTARAEVVNAKGKGIMQTFWCEPNSSNSGGASERSLTETEVEDVHEPPDMVPESHLTRLVDWNVEMFEELLYKLQSRRQGMFRKQSSKRLNGSSQALGLPRDEMTDACAFPKRLPKSTRLLSVDVCLDPEVSLQLRAFITGIANMHSQLPYNNFEHGCHVAMSTRKLLERIADHEVEESERSEGHDDKLYRTTLDPLTHFALAFAALIHHVHHAGVSNDQLVREESQTAIEYDGKSINEQAAIDTSWALLMEPRFADLRDSIYTNESERKRFRQIVVHSVLASDLDDPDLLRMREVRWEKSFSSTPDESPKSADSTEDANRKASIVIDLISRVSHASHMMQHFTVYTKWNLLLLTEVYQAYRNGRHSKDPSDTWYESQLAFFDDHVIPLGQQLRECGVFGVACDEFLAYANDNRLEWETNGRDIVRDAVQELQCQ